MRNPTASVRKRTVLAVMAMTTLFATLVAAPAMAVPKGEYAVFAECPTANAALSGCIAAKAEKGSIQFGKQTVPIVNTQTLQGGFIESELGEFTFVEAAKGNTLTKTPQKVPGGLLGINCTEITNEGLRKSCESIFENKLTAVYATVELAAPASEIYLNETNLVTESGTALGLPIKVKLENPLFGSKCYIGSNAKPIVVDLTTGSSGSLKGRLGEVSARAEGEILVIKDNSLVNDTIGVPAAEGCGLATGLVNEKLGLPSEKGKNKVNLEGTIEQTAASAAREHE